VTQKSFLNKSKGILAYLIYFGKQKAVVLQNSSYITAEKSSKFSLCINAGFAKLVSSRIAFPVGGAGA